MPTLRIRHTARRTVRPALLSLEGRAVPTVFTVSNTLDGGPGSLRQAILDANTTAGVDSVAFAAGVTGTITVGAALGELAVTDELAIVGPGASLVTVEGSNARLFNSSAPIQFSGLTLSKGSAATGFTKGGAILSQNSLSLSDCILIGNTAGGFQPQPPFMYLGYGGAVWHGGGSLLVERCQFLNNIATYVSPNPGSTGGAVDIGSAAGPVLFRDCDFNNNQAGNGAGICVGGSSVLLTLERCTFDYNRGFSENGVGGAVGGPFFGAPALVTAQNCTFTRNFANKGGALYLATGSVLQNCTVTNNSAYDGQLGHYVGSGGGIFGSVNMESTIVSGNSNIIAPDIGGAAAAKNCAIGSPTGFTYTNLGGNRPFGQNLMLGPLQNNGGLTPTVGLLAGSPCINTGSNPAGLATDQRGTGFVRVSGSAADIGAFEVQGLPAAVAGVQVNDGSTQRSRVTSLTVTFSEPVSLPPNPAAAFQLKRQSDDSAVTLIATMTGPAVTLAFAGGPVESGSLADGRYTLTARAAQINGGNFDGNGDGTPGDDYVLVGGPASMPKLFRLFGDADGNGVVDVLDFGAFRQTFGSADPAFDFDGSGSVDALDFGQFRQRFGSAV